MKTPSNLSRWSLTLAMGACLAGLPLTLAACEKEESHSKTTTTKTTETPAGTKKTTETTEQKVETEHKNPPSNP